MNKTKIAVIGSGNWGSTIAKIVGKNILDNEMFDSTLKMFVYEEIIDNCRLTEIINTKHENVKYLPGHIFTENVKAIPNIVEASFDADILIIVVPHEFVSRLCQQMVGKIKPTATAVSLCKGLDYDNGKIDLISNLVSRILNIECAVMMGANIAKDIADKNFSESTIGCKNKNAANLLKCAIQTDYFRLTICQDTAAVELCGALKNIVAVGVGLAMGMGLGASTQAAIIRLGLMEIIAFSRKFFDTKSLEPFFESCGVADLYATCLAAELAKTGKSVQVLEEEMLNGQKWQGPPTAKEVYSFLCDQKMETSFPLFSAVHNICQLKEKPQHLIESLRNHPEHY